MSAVSSRASGRPALARLAGGCGARVGAVRICSFLPSATEIVADLGLVDSLVGVSEECRWPPEVVGKPVVTAARIDPATMSSLGIDEAVRASVRDGRSLYSVEADLIDALSPDVIVTQDLCAVCAVSSGELAEASLVDAEVISLDPHTLVEVAETVRRLRLAAWREGARRRTRCSNVANDRRGRCRSSWFAEAPRVLCGVDRSAVLCRTLASGDDRPRRRRRRSRSSREAIASDDLGARPFLSAGARDCRAVRLRCRSGRGARRADRVSVSGDRGRRRCLLLAPCAKAR